MTNNREYLEELAASVVLEGAFVVIVGLASLRLPPLDPVLWYITLGLASYRGGRAIAFNYVFKWLRDILWVEEVEDSSGAGMSTEPGGAGWRHTLSELCCCPICAGTWVAIILYAIYSLNPQLGSGYALVLAGAGVAELLHWGSEYLGWGGRKSREEAGKLNKG